MRIAAQIAMDRSGRLVVPKSIREAAGIEPGMPLEIRVDDGGCIEIEPSPIEVRIVRKGPLHVAVPVAPVEPLTAETVRQTQRGLREGRKGR